MLILHGDDTYLLIEEGVKNAFLVRITSKTEFIITKYVVAYGFDITLGSWQNGEYYTDFKEAVRTFLESEGVIIKVK